MLNMLDFAYPAVLNLFEKHTGAGRTDSQAFLVWFLENYFRLDEVEAIDAVCDGPDDKGIDGIYVDNNLESIDVFQSKLLHNPTRTLGDTQLKEFVGTLAQFESPDNVNQIAETTSNKELSKLIKNEDVARKIHDGYSVRGVFVTNIPRDMAANLYLNGQPNLVVYDSTRLQDSYVPTGPSAPTTSSITFDIYGYDSAEYQIGDTKVLAAPLSATDLIKLDGIGSGKLFAWNVRQTLGKTKVNKEIGSSIDDQNEHKNFLLYHNGLTILCTSIERVEDKITISGYSVVNGCQSLTSLYEHRGKVTSELRILARLIEISPENDLGAKITQRSNNQNAINARDLQSNSSLQRRLQQEFENQYSGKVFYTIKRGEQTDIPDVEVIDNEEAARVLLAFDLKQPWACHQSYRLFEELHSNIFARPEVNAHRILVLHAIYEIVTESMTKIVDELMSHYSLTKFFLLYLLREALDSDEVGKQFCRKPEDFITASNGRARISDSIRKVVDDLIIDLNAEIRERVESDNPIDYKRELKSPNSVRELARNIIPQYQKALVRGRVPSFGSDWNAAGEQ